MCLHTLLVKKHLSKILSHATCYEDKILLKKEKQEEREKREKEKKKKEKKRAKKEKKKKLKKALKHNRNF